jgi:hypothetical protein
VVAVAVAVDLEHFNLVQQQAVQVLSLFVTQVHKLLQAVL